MTDATIPPGSDRSAGHVHDSASVGYSSGAETYEAGRPDYPTEAATWLRDVVGVCPGRTVLEVGAGTGALTTRLADTGARLCVLEPVSAMRAKLVRRVPDASVVAATAAAIPIRDASIDIVVCAQSFHWFATRQALDECSRVLVPDGVLALLWNVRDETVPWVKRLSAITDAYEGDTPRFRTGEWRHVLPGSAFVEIDHRQVSHAHVGSVDQVIVARTLSVSFVAAMVDEQRRVVERRLRAFVDDEPALAGRSRVAFPYQTAMFAYRKRAP